MNSSDEERSIGGGEQTVTGTEPAGRVNAIPGLADAAVDTMLSIDELLKEGRRTRRTARICLKADLQQQLDETLTQLATLVDVNGDVVSEGELALSDHAQAADLTMKAAGLRAEIDASMRSITFEGMAEAEWDAFVKKHQKPNTSMIADPVAYMVDLVSTCAVSPKLSANDVATLRRTLTAAQIAEVLSNAERCNTEGGITVPKSPNFLLARLQQESATS